LVSRGEEEGFCPGMVTTLARIVVFSIWLTGAAEAPCPRITMDILNPITFFSRFGLSDIDGTLIMGQLSFL
jgi:hypothetical protein